MKISKNNKNKTHSVSLTAGEVKFSKHARQRLEQRGLQLSPTTQNQLVSALDTLSHKGGRSSLILFDQLAMLVSVTKRTVITVIGREQLAENAFTDIDSVIVVSA